MASKITIKNFIDGEFRDPANGVYKDKFCPSTGKVFAEFADSGEKDINAAVAAAKRAFPSWSRTQRAERSKIMNKMADLIEERVEQFAQAESIDQGKPITLSRTGEIPRAAYNLRFFAGQILYLEESSTDLDAQGVLNVMVRQPVGVAALISPWNLPLLLLTWKVAPCIATGNTCVAKPSEMTPLTAFLFCNVMRDAGLPAGVVNIVHGIGNNAGTPLVCHPDVPLVSFTGGTATGIRIMSMAAAQTKKISLELGGKNPNIIFNDADLSECIPNTIRSSFQNQGEICLCGSRIYVQRGIYNEFLSKFISAVQAMHVGDPMDPKTTMGALISADHKSKVLSYIQSAIDEGGKIEIGGLDTPSGLPEKCQNGYFVRPTIITGLKATAKCNQEEIFGPVVTVTPFDTEEEVIALANGVKYGLSASVWTTNIHTAQNVSFQLHAGTVWVNCWMVRDLKVPFGGAKASGIGREGGKYSIEFFTEHKTICFKHKSHL